ncbi:MAG: hypothetical protein ACP5NC_05325, partial [Nitrososphaeria archaeon]
SYVSSITYPQAIQKWIYRNSITLPKIGRMVKHRTIKGKVKTVTKKYKNGEWHAIIAVGMEETKAATSSEIKSPVGIDSGLTDFIYLSDGTHVENPKFIKKRVRKAQKNLSRKKLLLTRGRQDYNNAKVDWQREPLCVIHVARGAGVIILQRALAGMPKVTPVETPTAGHQTGASCVSLNQEISSFVADEHKIAALEAHAF